MNVYTKLSPAVCGNLECVHPTTKMSLTLSHWLHISTLPPSGIYTDILLYTNASKLKHPKPHTWHTFQMSHRQ